MLRRGCAWKGVEWPRRSDFSALAAGPVADYMQTVPPWHESPQQCREPAQLWPQACETLHASFTVVAGQKSHETSADVQVDVVVSHVHPALVALQLFGHATVLPQLSTVEPQ